MMNNEEIVDALSNEKKVEKKKNDSTEKVKELYEKYKLDKDLVFFKNEVKKLVEINGLKELTDVARSLFASFVTTKIIDENGCEVEEKEINLRKLLIELNKIETTAKKDPILEGYNEVKFIADNQNEDWLVQGWAEFGCLHLLTGLPFGGKSTLVAEFIASICNNNTNMCGLPCQQVPIILFDYENKERILMKRINRALEGVTIGAEQFFHRLAPDSLMRPLTIDYIKTAVKKVTDGKCCIIIDTLRSAFGLDELSPVDIYNALVPLKSLANDLNAVIVVLHHNAKYSNTYSGTTALAGAVDYLWNCQKNVDTQVTTLKWEGRGDVMPDASFNYLDGRLLYRDCKVLEEEMLNKVFSKKEKKENKSVSDRDIVKNVMLENPDTKSCIKNLAGKEGIKGKRFDDAWLNLGAEMESFTIDKLCGAQLRTLIAWRIK